jgi:hypothetical protein
VQYRLESMNTRPYLYKFKRKERRLVDTYLDGCYMHHDSRLKLYIFVSKHFSNAFPFQYFNCLLTSKGNIFILL